MRGRALAFDARVVLYTSKANPGAAEVVRELQEEYGGSSGGSNGGGGGSRGGGGGSSGSGGGSSGGSSGGVGSSGDSGGSSGGGCGGSGKRRGIVEKVAIEWIDDEPPSFQHFQPGIDTRLFYLLYLIW